MHEFIPRYFRTDRKMEWENKINIWKAHQYSLTQRKTTLFLNSPSFNILTLKIAQIKLLKT